VRSRWGETESNLFPVTASLVAAIGQIALGRTFDEIFSKLNVATGLVLVTIGDTETRRRYLNARATINSLLDWKAIPIINENDTVATSEIRYGDNDRLAARVATMVDADLLILLSDIDGLYSAPPATDPNAKLAGGAAMIIASGKNNHPVGAIQAGGKCTFFSPAEKPVNQRKKWIAGGLGISGQIEIDAGAWRAVQAGSSLLPAGVTKVSGEFQRGDTIEILVDGKKVACGLSQYDVPDAAKIAGMQSEGIEAVLGGNYRVEMVHRDDLVVLISG